MPDPSLSDSEKRILGRLFRQQVVTQGDLVQAFDFSQQTISRLMGGLAERGYVTSGDKISGTKGYRAATFRLAGNHALSAGISITAGTVTLVVLDFAGNVMGEDKAHLRSMDVENVAAWVGDRLSGSIQQVGGRPVGCGVSVAGSFIDGRRFNTPAYLEDWAGIDVAAVLTQRLGMPVWADNDGNAAALAESLQGVGRHMPSFAYLYLSAGVGGGVILNGEPWRGRHGNAGEFAGGLPPNLYPFPNLELLRVLLAQDDIAFDTVDDLVRHYDPSWPAIQGWIERVRDSVSIIASNAAAILDLDAIVIGGLIPRDLAERLIARIDLFDQRRRSTPRPIATLVPCEVTGNAAAVGAAMLPLRALFFTPGAAQASA